TIESHGEVRAPNTATIASEVHGRVVYAHPGLEKGELIREEEILFRIDPRDHEAARDEIAAEVRELENAISRMKREQAADRERLKTLARSESLAKGEFERIQRLFKTHKVGTRSGVDQAERNYNAASDLADQLARGVALYPFRIKEAKNRAAAARARLAAANAGLARCTVRAPFHGRVVESFLEAHQYVTPGLAAVTLADDSILEIETPIDGRDALEGLLFHEGEAPNGRGWFHALEEVPCRVQWVEWDEDAWVEGRVDRVVKFDRETRTLVAAVRLVDPGQSTPGGVPLVEGMFCRIQIPGKTLENVIRLPRSAVAFDGSIHVVSEGRLKTTTVTMARAEDEHVFVSGGLNPGDLVIVTRLINPMENALLEVVKASDLK
ncbi:MAG: hypothetical protein GY859_17415, partial [Desulfobacterales bacterium]|nr:hypothetical protein [Desulfobacterales bacterium]